MDKLAILPSSSGYSVTYANESLAVKLDGGASRYRKDILGAWSLVDVTFTVTSNVYQYLMAFYVRATERASEPFLIDLVLDADLLTEHQANFIPGSLRLTEHSGDFFVLSAQLEVKPNVLSDEFLDALIVIGSTYGDDSYAFLLSLEHLVNVVMPENLL